MAHHGLGDQVAYVVAALVFRYVAKDVFLIELYDLAACRVFELALLYTVTVFALESLMSRALFLGYDRVVQGLYALLFRDSPLRVLALNFAHCIDFWDFRVL